MHVAIDGRVIDNHFPGIGRYVFHLTDALARSRPRDEFTLLTSGASETDDPMEARRRLDPMALASLDRLQLLPVDAPVFGLSAQWRLPVALRRSRAEIFHATYWLTAYRPGLPTVLSLYDLIGLRQPRAVPPARRLALRVSLRLAIRSARLILTLSESARDDLVRHAGLKPDKVIVTPLAADARFRPPSTDQAAAVRARYGLPERFVLYVGSNKPHKNLPTLVEAWKRLRLERGDDGVALILAGHRDPRYGPFPDQLPPNARDIGPIAEPDLPALYGAATAFAFPSRHEGFGLPALEAMACGTPVISADASSLPEVVGQSGLLVPPNDVRAWARAMARVLDDRSEAERLVVAGRTRSASFTWERTARLTAAAYERALRPS